ncbi:MAG TPA: transposase [Coxiellaceae bacterium]|nr:MAG: hypothetical protein A3E81_03730 [Gammaproteobacteria bacterium RIFCSPHIGHO2_12_FULL_36_30]HLB56134.1 transposase [Coxiellaceae bacterium]
MQNKKQIPIAYIITCRTYATWLHGDARLSVDPKHNQYATPKIPPMSGFQKTMRSNCKEEMFIMDESQRKIVLQSIIDTCKFSNWHLHAAQVRTNHMHVVVTSEKAPEKIAISLKAYATRYLKQQNPELNRERFWSRGASTGYIFQEEFLFRAMQYTIEDQGKEMAVYCDPSYYKIIETI